MDDLLTTDACTLPTAERPLRLAEFEALFASTRTVERRPGHVRVHLAGSDGLLDRVRDLADRESSCCSFFTFVVEARDDEVVLDISVPPGRQDLLDALAASVGAP